MSKITYANKQTLNENTSIADINKVKASDLNEIKTVVNQNDDNIGNLSNLNTTDKTSIVNAINDFFYKAGDTFTAIDLMMGGFISSSAQAIYFTITVPKSTSKINSATIDNLKITVRSISGYLLNKIEITDSTQFDGTYSIFQINKNSLSVIIKSSKEFSAANNTPLAIEIKNIQISFNNVTKPSVPEK